jgi:hypothetical protein
MLTDMLYSAGVSNNLAAAKWLRERMQSSLLSLDSVDGAANY